MGGSIPVVKAAGATLIHTAGLVRYGSKPFREIAADGSRLVQLNAGRRSFADARRYLPNQVFIGEHSSERLRTVSAPWFDKRVDADPDRRPFGGIFDESAFIALLALADPFKNVVLLDRFWDEIAPALRATAASRALVNGEPAVTDRAGLDAMAAGGGLPLVATAPEPVGWIRNGHSEDDSLSAAVLLENLCAKVSAALAMEEIFTRNDGFDRKAVSLVLGCSEEAVGDRYQRGGGNLAKAIAEFAGCEMASGFDVKDFCAAPIPALVTAAALVQTGVFADVVVVGGGSLPKLGMKFLYHCGKGMPVLEDMLAAVAVWVGRDDGRSPVVNLDAVGRHPVSAGASLDQQLKSLVCEPLDRLGLDVGSVDKFVTELHNPEITVPANGGDVAERNYRMLGAVLAKAGKIGKGEIAEFSRAKGVPGYAPTQGHIASALAYVPHAVEDLTRGSLNRCFLFARASLFLGQMTQLSDGMSVLLERNSRAG
jgi:betaine reductase